MNRRVMLSGLLAGTASAALLPAIAGASAKWCEDDPLVVIKTPTGYQLPVHVTVYAEGAENQVYLDRIPLNADQSNPWISWTVVRSKKGGQKPTNDASATAVQWDVVVNVTVQTDPGDGEHFRTRAVASSDVNATGVRYADRYGTANHVMELHFSLWA